MSKRQSYQQSTLLPTDARDALVAASQLRNPTDRKRAVQEAIERAKRRYPQLFNVKGVTP
jgi:ABC-type iron transport system FetAB ATPase subunit